MKALLIVLGDPNKDPRPQRILNLLMTQRHLVSTISYPTEKNGKIKNQYFLPFSKTIFGRIKRYLKIQIARRIRSHIKNPFLLNKINNFLYDLTFLKEILIKNSYNLIFCEDLFTLPLAAQFKKDAKLVFDAREYYPSQNEESLNWRKYEKPERIRICKGYISKVDYFLTVSNGLAKKYKNMFGAHPLVLRSTPYFVNIQPKKTKLKVIRIVHHGMANYNRQLHKIIDVAFLLDTRFHLDMYLEGNRNEIKRLLKYAEGDSRISIKKPVPYSYIPRILSKYDIGIFYNEPSTFNLLHCLPNKIFEYIQARLCVAIGPSPDMAEIVRQYKCGVVAAEFSAKSMANALNALTLEKIDRYKQMADKAARTLNFEKESLILLKIFDEAKN
jgi:glycosyltransferase involved in cell wall biosynthesis